MPSRLTLLWLLLHFSTTGQQHYFSAGGGTTILTIVNKDSIIIAADSRHAMHFFDGRIIIDTVCKIARYEDIFYCFSGTSDISYKNNKVFNVYDILRSCLRKNIDLKNALRKFNLKLNRQVRKMYRYVGTGYFLDSLPGRSLLEIVMVRFRNHQPEYIFGDYQVTGNNKKNISVQFFEDLFDTRLYFNKAGYHEHIDSFLIKNPGFFSTAGTIENSLVELIKLESIKHPQKVACPVDIIVIRNKAHEWVKRNYDCR
jgi:hypothetical protein